MNTFQDGNRREFVERRKSPGGRAPGVERRQFANSHSGLSPDARELAEAIDSYKIRHSRRFITFEEMLTVIQDLGYTKVPVSTAAARQ
jgi:hypothetical protein